MSKIKTNLFIYLNSVCQGLGGNREKAVVYIHAVIH